MNNKYQIDLLIYSTSIEDYSNLENSNKVILNQKILSNNIDNVNLEYPMIFKLSSSSELGKYETFVSVHDFTACNNKIYVPYHIAETLLIDRNDYVNIEIYIPPKGNYIKLKPKQKEFYNILDIKDFLSIHIQKYYQVIIKGSILKFPYRDMIIELIIIDCKPFDVIVTSDTDISVEFEPFTENNKKSEIKNKPYNKKSEKWYPFCGLGNRLGHK